LPGHAEDRSRASGESMVDRQAYSSTSSGSIAFFGVVVSRVQSEPLKLLFFFLYEYKIYEDGVLIEYYYKANGLIQLPRYISDEKE